MKIPSNLDGVSILPSLLGQATQQQQHAYLYWEFHENDGRQAVRWGKWKGVRLNVSNVAPMELYDLDADPGETKDVATAHPDIIARLDSMMKEAHTPDKNWPLLPGEGRPAQ